MARRKVDDAPKEPITKKKTRPARTPEENEQQLINLAMKQARLQLENGTASSQIITHFLQLGTQKYILEQEKLKAETEMARAKVADLQEDVRSRESYDEVIESLKSYGANKINTTEIFSEDNR